MRSAIIDAIASEREQVNEASDYLASLSDFVCATCYQRLPPAAVDRARWVIADSLAVIAAGMQAPEMQAFAARYLKPRTGDGAWVIGAGRRARRFDAALLNGAAGTWFELDEGNVHASGHPGIQLVPAVLAYAQEEGASGADILLATVLGYEVSSRIARSARMKSSVHPHGTWGVIGAAVGVGCLAQLTAPQMRETINIAATMGMTASYGTLHEGATVRNIYSGHSNMMGQTAVVLAQSGFTGENDGVQAIYGQLLSDGFDTARALSGLGTEWLFLDSYFKLHPTGRAVHSAIDALQDALAKVPAGRIEAASVERIDVTAYRKTAVMAQKNVRSSFGAKFSVPFALATLIRHGRSGLDAFGDAAVADPVVQALCQRVHLAEEASYTSEYPRRQLCDVRIVLRDGSVLAGHTERMKGEPENPYGPEELGQKYRELTVPIWGQARADRLLADCMRLETIGDFRAYSSAFEL